METVGRDQLARNGELISSDDKAHRPLSGRSPPYLHAFPLSCILCISWFTPCSEPTKQVYNLPLPVQSPIFPYILRLYASEA